MDQQVADLRTTRVLVRAPVEKLVWYWNGENLSASAPPFFATEFVINVEAFLTVWTEERNCHFSNTWERYFAVALVILD